MNKMAYCVAYFWNNKAYIENHIGRVEYKKDRSSWIIPLPCDE